MNKKTWFLAILLPVCLLFSTSTMANLVLGDGGATGQWYNINRDGEGVIIEIVESNGGPRAITISWFTYDQFGDQMWLQGSATLGEDAKVVSIPVFVTDGPIFGPTYDPADLNLESWGTIEVLFQTCSQGNMTYTSSGALGTGSITLSRITTVVNVNCVEPPTETSPVTPGLWTGPGVCLYVAEDGLSITSEGSTCTGGHAFNANVQGAVVGGVSNCNVNVICPDDYAIYSTGDLEFPQATFDCKDLGGIASGTFFEGGVNGPVYDRSDGEGCVAAWLATPDDG